MTRLAGYTLHQALHEDAGVALYRGHRAADGAKVLIKLLSAEYPSAASLAQLRHEFALMNELDGPGVIRPIALEADKSGLALVMADPGGQVLSAILDSQPLDLGAALRVVIALVAALAAVHAQGIVLRRVTPQSILIDAALRDVTLFDFSLAARLMRYAQRAVAPPILGGSIAYMAPEQTGRMNRGTDHRADLYAAGVILYQMLTGALPFKGDDPMKIVHGHLARTPVAPHEREPGVPEGVSRIVMKLLSKAPEERYQRAAGLLADLEACLSAWTTEGWVAPFPLGRRDIRQRVELRETLYGREEERAALLAAFERAGDGEAELALVAGGAGVGKSALVREIQRSVARRDGYFVTGKFDVYGGGSTPYAAIAGALRELVQQILAERAEVVERYREEILRAVSPNGSVIAKIIPELEQLIGRQPAVMELGPVESQNRFNLVFQSFLHVFVKAEHPLALFLDDMQWADPGSLKLLRTLLDEGGRLLVIGAYRDREVSAGHPLLVAIEEHRRSGRRLTELKLGELSVQSLEELVADALGSPRADVAELAALLFEKTRGNAFFTNQLLLALEDERLLHFDAARSRFTWDVARVRERMTTDDVVNFMIGRIRRFPAATQHALTLSACIGYRFDLKTLSVILERAPGVAARDIQEAIRDGLLTPLHPEYRLVDSAVDQDASAELPFDASEIVYQFLHDRVQQAAYQMLPEDARPALHLRIGRLLAASGATEAAGDEIFDITRHLNLGVSLITDPEERIDVARRNLAAGRRARSGSAHETAADYFAAGVALLPPSSFEDHYELAFALHRSWAECLFLSGQPERAEAMFEDLLVRARDLAERVEIFNLRVVLCFTSSRLADAIRASARGFALFGISMPETEEAREAALKEEIAQVDARLSGRRIEELIDAPRLTDPDQRSLLRLLASVYVPMYTMMSPTAAALCTAKMVNISLQYGNAEPSGFGYVIYGFTLQASSARAGEGYAFCQLGIALNDRLGGVEFTCRLNVLYSLSLHLSRSRHVALEHALRAHQAGLTSGDFPFLSYSCDHILFCRMCLGYELHTTIAEADRFLALNERTKEKLSRAIIRLLRQLARALAGQTKSPTTFDDGVFSEAQFQREQEEAHFTPVLFLLRAYRVQVLLLHGEPSAALDAALQADALAYSLVGQYPATELVFFTGLARAAVARTAAEPERSEHLEALARCEAQLSAWAESCPDNYRHKSLLLRAEIAHLAGEERALDLYERAVLAARQSGFASEECIASELSGRYLLQRGIERLAAVYLREAHRGYLRWGAAVKAAALESTYPRLLLEEASPRAPRASAPRGRGLGTDDIDLTTVMRAAHAISSETELDGVLGSMMRLIIENVGAQRGVLLLGDELEVAAHAVMDLGGVSVTVGREARAATRLPGSLIEEAMRADTPLVVADATKDERWLRDAYVIELRPRSILVVPMRYRGWRKGLLYLENRAAPDVFTPSPIELTEMLVSHAAIAVENARLTERLRSHNATLANEVERRTEELFTANAQLQRELVERQRAEEARAELQEEIIRRQNERLEELSTPIIPISDGILVMPLIGVVDAPRAQQAREAALRRAADYRATAVLLDVTGVRTGGGEVASMLLMTAGALRLLGVQAVITGIGPDMARALVQAGATLEALRVCATLESGIALAKRLSRRAAPS